MSIELNKIIAQLKSEIAKLQKMQNAIQPDQLVDSKFVRETLSMGQDRLIGNLPLLHRHGLRWHKQGSQYKFSRNSVFKCLNKMVNDNIDLPKWEHGTEYIKQTG